jgi:hypothetical protein
MRYAVFALVSDGVARVFATVVPVDEHTAAMALLRRLGALGLPSGRLAAARVNELPGRQAAVLIEAGRAVSVVLIDDEEEARAVRALAAQVGLEVQVVQVEIISLRAASGPEPAIAFCGRCEDYPAPVGGGDCAACRRLDDWRSGGRLSAA